MAAVDEAPDCASSLVAEPWGLIYQVASDDRQLRF
jgi:hypothetical protein